MSRAPRPARTGWPGESAGTWSPRAIIRADALVEIAQGYLRGDRPDRPPIEVMLTIPASMLRDDSADPLDVGEIGASFLSREAARRLSCDAGVVEILEARDARSNDYGLSRLSRRIRTARGKVDDLVKAILADIDSHCGERGQRGDDMTLVAMSIDQRRAKRSTATFPGILSDEAGPTRLTAEDDADRDSITE